MSRGIGFRAWLTLTEELCPVLAIYWHDGDIVRVDLATSLSSDPLTIEGVDLSKDIILEPYTGHKDKNGVEIAMGDILERDGVRFVVYWDEEYAGFNWKGASRDVFTCEGLVDIARFGKVVGNVHKNPELLGSDTNVGIKEKEKNET